MAEQNYSIVVIEDDKQVIETIENTLNKEYSKISSFDNSESALDKMHILRPDIILLDTFIGHTNGLDVLELIRKQGYTIPVIMMTAASDIKMSVHAIKMGAEDFILKPLNIEQLDSAIKRAITHHEMKKRVEILSEKLKIEQPEEILGNSECLQDALKMAKTISGADTTILIYGESGTGKELFAKFIHENSNRNTGPFITINCGAIPREIAENELFGYERGAFTGAIDKIKHGKFEQAHKGTILFDEISELSLDLQVKLLRVLQERKFFRLGGSKEIAVDVRVLASTNKDLEPLVHAGRFREDLYYRLNVAKFRLPPLRERGDDIMLLATEFVAEFNKVFNKSITGFEHQAVRTLKDYPWNGNIRELKNAVERIVLLETETVISNESLDFLKTSLLSSKGEKMVAELKDGDHILHISKVGASYNNVLKDLIIQTLKLNAGNIAKASKSLGMSTVKLEERIIQSEISKEDYS